MQGSGNRKLQRGRSTLLFIDVVGYNALAESTSPDDAYRVITRCIRLLDSVARRHGGAVDKYLGDALLVIFGLPAPLEGAETAAVRAALEMRSLVEEYRRGSTSADRAAPGDSASTDSANAAPRDPCGCIDSNTAAEKVSKIGCEMRTTRA